MTFFYDLNKKLAGISDTPEAKQLNEGTVAEKISPPIKTNPAERGKYQGKDIGDLKAMKAANLKKTAGYRERGEKVPDELKGKTAELNFALRAKQAHGGKWGKIKEEEIDEGLGDMVSKAGSMAKKAGSAVLNKLGHGSDEDMIRDLQKKAGVPVTGKVAPQQPGQRPAPGQQQMEEEGGTPMTAKQKAFAKLAPPEDKITFADKIAGAKQEVDEMLGDVAAEAMKAALSPKQKKIAKLAGDPNSIGADDLAMLRKGKKQIADEGWDDMMKDVERRRSATKKGEITHGHKHDIEDTGTGRRVTRRVDPNTGYSVGADDDKPADGEKRGRGRPKKADKAPERVTAKAYKHKGGRKMTKEEIDEAISALEEAGYSVKERKLSSSEKEEREDIVKGMKKNKAGFEKRYGKRGEEVMYATATKMAKERGPGNPDRKKKEKTEESGTETTKSKGGMSFGKGIYDSLNRELEGMIAESMNVSVNMSIDEHGEPHKNITVSAEGEAAEQLAQLLNLAGMQSSAYGGSGYTKACGCSEAACSCNEMVDENAPDWPTEPEVTGADDPQMTRWSGGVDGPKGTGQTTVPVVASQLERQHAYEAKELGMQLYAELKSFKG